MNPFTKPGWLRCEIRGDEFGICGNCTSCIFTDKLTDSTKWLTRTGDSAKRKFLTGLLTRCRSVPVLESIRDVLQVTYEKDFTYTRSNKPSLLQDVTRSSNRELNRKLLSVAMVETLAWFSSSHDWVKSNYLLSVLSLCDTELLRMLANLNSVLLAREQRAYLEQNAFKDEVSSTSESTSTFCSQDHPHLELLMQASSLFEPIDLCNDNTNGDRNDTKIQTCHTPAISRNNQLSNLSKCSGSGLRDWQRRKVGCGDKKSDCEDPALTVVPGSSASMSGVSRYRDFLRCLPVHLAKRILGLLDKHTLRCSKSVSLHWKYLVEDIILDMNAEKAVKNQLLIMQSNRNNRIISDVYANVLQVLVPVKADEECDIPTDSQKVEIFDGAYANLRTKTVKMEARNVYCGLFSYTVLLDQEDPHRVVHHGGGQLVAIGSKDCALRLLNVASKKEVTPVLKGHVGSIRAVLLCEDRDMVFSAGYDLTIRCWSLRTKACVMLLRGHTGTVNCLDIQNDNLVSGAKDCKVKVWNMQNRKCLQNLKFKHSSPVQCVKIDSTVVYSSCAKGVVKMWQIENASLIRVIDSHRGCSVKGLFFDRWHLLSGDSEGRVMAWSTNCEANKCLMTFNHPKEVQTLTLTYLCVVTGCMDGKLRVFDFLTGDCLRVIKSGSKLSPILSIHCHGNNVLVNTRSSLLLYQFVKVCWDYASASEPRCSVTFAGADRKHPASPGKFSRDFVRADRTALVGSPRPKIYGCEDEKPERPELSCHTRYLSARRTRQAQDSQQESTRPSSRRQSKAYIDLLQPEFKPPSTVSPGRPASPRNRETIGTQRHTLKGTGDTLLHADLQRRHTVKVPSEKEKSVKVSERTAWERVKKRGLHHPLTTECILLRVNSIQQALVGGEAAVNMELNAQLRDAWGPSAPWGPSREAPKSSRTSPVLTQNHQTQPRTNSSQSGGPSDVSDAGAPHSATVKTGVTVRETGPAATSAKREPLAPKSSFPKDVLKALERRMNSDRPWAQNQLNGSIYGARGICASHRDSVTGVRQGPEEEHAERGAPRL